MDSKGHGNPHYNHQVNDLSYFLDKCRRANIMLFNLMWGTHIGCQCSKDFFLIKVPPNIENIHKAVHDVSSTTF